MSQNEIKFYDKLIVIPKDKKGQDKFIGLWRRSQEKAINILKYDLDYIKNVDLEVDKKTYEIYRKLGGYNVYR